MSDAITGRTLEQLVIFRAQKLEEQGILTLGRYGTMVVMMNDEHGIPRWQPKPSLPDLEGVIAGSGRQLILELKACSQASYPIYGTDRKRPRQIEHMMKRAKFGALCYIMIHFNQRDLKTKYQGAFTIAIPVHPDHDFWRQVEATEIKNLDRATAILYGITVPWNLYSPRASKLTPDLRVLFSSKKDLIHASVQAN